jgi:hypothetical protein
MALLNGAQLRWQLPCVTCDYLIRFKSQVIFKVSDYYSHGRVTMTIQKSHDRHNTASQNEKQRLWVTSASQNLLVSILEVWTIFMLTSH